MPSGATSHSAGARKLRGSSGWRTRSVSTAPQMTMKAASVPMLTSSATSPIGRNPATRAMNTPSTRVGRAGVPCLGCTCANQPGSRPSRARAKAIRAAPSMKANSTLVMPAIAATEITARTQSRPSALNAASTGAGESSC